MLKKSLLALGAGLLFLTSCYYDKKEEVYPQLLLNTACDTTSTMTYSNHVSVILRDNCYSCHSTAIASGGIILDTYTDVNSVVQTGQLQGAVEHQQGYIPMPSPSTQISVCQITQIRKWIQAGAPNN